MQQLCKKIENGVKAIDGIDGCAVNFAASTITVSAGGKNEQWMKDEVAKKVKSIDPHVTVRAKHEDKPGEDEYRKKLHLMLVRLAAGAVLAVIAYFAHTGAVLEFLLFFASYLIIGGDIVARAGKTLSAARYLMSIF